MNSINILYGFDDERFIADLEKRLEEKYENVISTIKFSKEAITEYLKSHSDCNTVVLLETNGCVTYEAEEIAEYMDIRELNIIVVVSSKHKGTDYMQTLYSAGIMNAIFDSIKADKIVELIHEKRDRIHARTYYGIAGLNSLQKILTATELTNMADSLYDPSFGSSVAERYIKLARSLSVENNKKFWDFIPDELKNEIAKYEEFYEIVELLKRAGYKIRYKKVPKRELKTILDPSKLEDMEEKRDEKISESVEQEVDYQNEREYDEEIRNMFREKVDKGYDTDIRDMFRDTNDAEKLPEKQEDELKENKQTEQWDSEEFDKNEKAEFTILTSLGVMGLGMFIVILAVLIAFVANKGAQSNEAMRAYMENSRNGTEVREQQQDELETELLEEESAEEGHNQQVENPTIVNSSYESAESSSDSPAISQNDSGSQEDSLQNTTEDFISNSNKSNKSSGVAYNQTPATTQIPSVLNDNPAQNNVDTEGTDYNYVPNAKMSEYSDMVIKEYDVLSGLEVINYINSHEGNYKVIGNVETLVLNSGEADAGKIAINEKYQVKVENGNWIFSVKKG